jgi:Leucine-rich repeat (LRR) protein
MPLVVRAYSKFVSLKGEPWGCEMNLMPFFVSFIALVLLVSCRPVSIEDVKHDPASYTELDFSYANLSSLPPYISKCVNLESISLVGNRFKSFPRELLSLPKLKKLNLSFNEIDSIPVDIQLYRELADFNVAGNKIRSIPRELGLLPALKRVNLSYNPIVSLPPDLAKSPTLVEILAYETLLVNPDSVQSGFPNLKLGIDYCLESDKGRYYLYRGTQYHNNQNAADAMRYYSKALSYDNSLAPAYGNRGLLKQQVGDLAGALADFNTSLQLDQQQPVIWLNRGVVSYNKGDKASACKDWQNAAQLGDKQAAAFLASYCQ